VHAVEQVSVEGRPYATLQVRRLGAPRAGHSLLGFSRDIQPFALVVLDEIETARAGLEAWSQAEPPLCFGAESDAPVLEHCGAKLRATLDGIANLEAVLTASTTRHELQHQIDGPNLARPALVRRHMKSYADWAVQKVNRELSAYLAEFASEQASPALSLLGLFDFAWTAPGAELTHVGMFALAALAEEEWGEDHTHFSAEQLARIYTQLSELGPDELRARAKASWEELYGGDLPVVHVNGATTPE
jgi:hypothetical protein